MKKQATNGFGGVKSCLNSLVDVVLKKAPEATTVHNLSSINTGMRIRNVQILLHAIETNNEDLNASL